MITGMLESVAKAFLTDQNSVILVIFLSLIAFVITKVTIDNIVIAIAALPMYFFSALYSNYWIRELGFSASTEKVANLAFACGVGFMAAILILVIGYRLIISVFSN